ncbi:formate dehydrogenase accessory sulfurtransferase FdhD [Sphingopyxis sp.]|jgi:FdhD protein|uniref:formate dehydrogenase accessory sulfurtransferase FdhD n=1 Tax=Sphingopyxis sp. TaxID=1908224 RepID=UPI00311F0F3A
MADTPPFLPRPVRRMGLGVAGDADIERMIAVEMPVSIEVQGLAYAVMMATPADLTDFGVGFALAEGFVDTAAQIDRIDAQPVPGGHALRLWLSPACAARALDRARTRVSESSCGLCGLENIDAVLRPLPPVTARVTVPRAAIARALAALPERQPLGRATGAAHAAAFCDPDGDILLVREDVGRHNALDKLVGALARGGVDLAGGFILLSARCSYELVEKTVRAGCPMLVTISAPTSLAAERAASAGLTLVSLARADNALIICDAQGMIA